ncbi:LysR family transcriptional regulator [Limnobacter sp.]|uniref:LysR family transcriptional regulator n=1 Tax=Limnobacter sp. TaxID=2003368 RepID=UPI003515799E
MNYRHLYYFWMVAQEGGFARAAERLNMAIQTVSVQVRELEQWMGMQLFKPVGRGVALTEAGREAFVMADEIFRLGQALPERVRAVGSKPRVQFRVGLCDGISKLAAHALLETVLSTPNLHLTCHEGEPEQLLAELALHHLDVVLAGEPPASQPNLRVQSRILHRAPVDWFGPAQWVRKKAVQQFPACLAQLPVLLPTGHSRLRLAINHWLEQAGVHANVVGEFEDSALMSVFAARGMGVFPVSRLGVGGQGTLSGLRYLGSSEDLFEEIHGVWSARGQKHPLLATLLKSA